MPFRSFRVEALKRLLRKPGFSRGAALEMSSCVRESTARLYQSQWLSFCGWCRGRGVAPIDATIPLIVDFLIHLRRDKGFSLSALKGYRSAINSVLALKGTDLAETRELAMLFRSFAKPCLTANLRPPAWDVALVLNSLTAAPCEPLKDAEECLLAHKTLLLLALASAKRVGELHALSHRVSHHVGWNEVSFSFVPGFVAKTQDQSSLDPQFESFTIPALPKLRGSPSGRLLCPVRAVKYYLSRTAQHCPRCERLFVASGRTKKEIFKNTLSFWLRRVISLAYQLSGKPLPTPSPLAGEGNTAGDPRYCPVPPLQEELRRQPGLKGRYLESSHHLHAPLPQGLVSQVPRHLPPGPCGGGSGHGINLASRPRIPYLDT